MSKSLIQNCFPLIRKRKSLITLVFWQQKSIKTLCNTKKHIAGEIMFEFPDQVVTDANSFFIGRQVPVLSMDDHLVPGRTYLILPIERFAYKILTTSCLFSMFNSNLETSNNINFTSPLSPPPFEYSRCSKGKVLIKVCPEFMIKLMCDKNGDNDDDEEVSESERICDSPELKRQYEQLVGTRDQMWSPKLQTISEIEFRVSPLSFLGIYRRKEEDVVKVKQWKLFF